MKIGILDCFFGGNIYNVTKAIDKLGHTPIITNSIKSDIDGLIIPGVGSFANSSSKINILKDSIHNFARSKPILGICLGMQLLAEKGFEHGENKGLGLISGECVKINTQGVLPNIGWRKLDIIKNSRLLANIENESFYFMHSYEVINYTDCVSLSKYKGHQFVSVIEHENIFGVQFHPEKSNIQGLKLLENFLKELK